MSPIARAGASPSGRPDPLAPQRSSPGELSGGVPVRWQVRVQRSGSPAQVLEFQASTDDEVLRLAAAQGWRVLALSRIDTASGHERAMPLGRGKFPLLLFSQELLALLDAGLNLPEALATLHAKERQAGVATVLAEVLASVREGRSLSDALGLLPQHFPGLYAASIKAAERTGNLPDALSRYIAYQLQFEAVRKKLISSAIYPVMLLGVGGLVTLFLLGYVVPRFSAVYESSGRELPWLSALLLRFGQMVYAHWALAWSLMLGTGVLLGWALSRPGGRAALLAQVLQLPWLAEKADELRLARFYGATSLLLSAGIALPRAMGMVEGLLGPAQQRRLSGARTAVEQGQSLSAALRAYNLASPVAESLVQVGERSGQLAGMLQRAARFHDDDFARWIDWASRLIEPVLMILIGLVIGTIVVLMYMPIFELAGSLQ